MVKPVNQHDSILLPESLDNLISLAQWLVLDLTNSYLTFDSGFDSEYNKQLILDEGLIPVIKPNVRNLGREKRYTLLDEFAPLQPIYQERYRIERTFAWQDKYRKLVISYERLQCTHLGFKYLAYTMINLRYFIKT